MVFWWRLGVLWRAVVPRELGNRLVPPEEGRTARARREAKLPGSGKSVLSFLDRLQHYLCCVEASLSSRARSILWPTVELRVALSLQGAVILYDVTWELDAELALVVELAHSSDLEHPLSHLAVNCYVETCGRKRT